MAKTFKQGLIFFGGRINLSIITKTKFNLKTQLLDQYTIYLKLKIELAIFQTIKVSKSDLVKLFEYLKRILPQKHGILVFKIGLSKAIV